MTAKTIICVISSLNVGGAERHIVQMLPRLDRNRWKPLVYCIKERGPLADELETNGVPVLTSPIKAPQKGASRVRRAMLLARTTLSLAGTIKKLNPAIAHFFLPAPYILGAPAALMARVPVRIMSRHEATNSRYHALLTRFKAKTGCSVLVNASFNVRGEPIICTPEDAFRCFMGSELDMLVVGNCILEKTEQVLELQFDYKREFELD